MDFEDFLKTIDVDASQNLLVFSLEDMKAAWDYQQARIDELEKWITAIADDHPQIPRWIRQSARSLLARRAE